MFFYLDCKDTLFKLYSLEYNLFFKIVYELRRIKGTNAMFAGVVMSFAFIDFFTIDDGSYEIALYDLLRIVVQEVAVINSHIGELADLD